MQFPRFTVLAAMAAILPGTALADPVINEFVANHAGTDLYEYVEVSGEPRQNMTDLAIVHIEGDDSGAGVVDDYFLIGVADRDGIWASAFMNNTLENGSLTLLLVRGFRGAAGDDLDADNDGILDAEPWEEVLDGVSVDDGDVGDQVYAETILMAGFDGGTFTVGGASRRIDGLDTDSPADWIRNDFDGDGLNAFDVVLGADEASNTPAELNSTADAPSPVTLALTIPRVQGTNHVSRYLYAKVIVEGVVTAVAFNGFYVQDPKGDWDRRTSNAIFVESPSFQPEVGSKVSVDGIVNETVPGGLGSGNLSITQIYNIFTTVLGTETVPSPVVVGRSGLRPSSRIVISKDEIRKPITLTDYNASRFDPKKDAIDFYESLEGMRVTFEQPVAVSPVRVFSAFSAEFFALLNDGADATPRDARTARGGINLVSGRDNTGDQNPERVQIQFDPTLYPGSTPAVVVGDKFEDVTGVLSYSFGNYELFATEEVVFRETSANSPETTSLTDKAGHLTIASYNVLNLNATSADDNQRALVADHIANNLGAPAIVALQEIQDNDGTGSGGVEADETLGMLVDEIAAAGGPTYKWAQVDPFDGETGGAPNGNIRNAFLYDSARVSFIQVLALRESELASANVTHPDAFNGSRFPLLGEFEVDGVQIALINNHLTSRFGSTPIFGGPQPFIQAGEAAREAQALALNEYVRKYIADGRGRHVIVCGDLNTFEFTDDLAEILPGLTKKRGKRHKKNAGYQVLYNLVNLIEDDNLYSFIFDGNSQELDHIFATRKLSKLAEFDVVHVNNDFPRDDGESQLEGALVGSDHEPLVARFNLSALMSH